MKTSWIMLTTRGAGNEVFRRERFWRLLTSFAAAAACLTLVQAVVSWSGKLSRWAIRLKASSHQVGFRRWRMRRSLPVHLGTFPHPAVKGPFDLITLIDVLEHVSAPVALLQNIAANLAPDGMAVVVTPDVKSIAARVLGWNWWHFRVAHIGYFNEQNLFLALDRAGLQPFLVRRPGWFFTADYLWERTHRYLPGFLQLAPPRFLSRLVVPVNLRDSWLVVCRRKVTT